MSRFAVLLALFAASCAKLVDHGEVCGENGED